MTAEPPPRLSVVVPTHDTRELIAGTAFSWLETKTAG